MSQKYPLEMKKTGPRHMRAYIKHHKSYQCLCPQHDKWSCTCCKLQPFIVYDRVTHFVLLDCRAVTPNFTTKPKQTLSQHRLTILWANDSSVNNVLSARTEKNPWQYSRAK